MNGKGQPGDGWGGVLFALAVIVIGVLLGMALQAWVLS